MTLVQLATPQTEDGVAVVGHPRIVPAGTPAANGFSSRGRDVRALPGPLTHLTAVESATFLGEPVTDWQATFRPAPQDGVADVVARYRATVERANETLDRFTDPGAPLPRPGRAGPSPSVRWALTHMIEETGRHAGHADILRELVDGTTGR
ncbi:DUF664 domain-containing protein [Kitasatospora sp. NPDC018058]|uniref:mycothiol transferase n=1 Tax=Kitasatospora sp. NPDC018058 TaxID=3364025 RepID=UPI0037C0EA5C